MPPESQDTPAPRQESDPRCRRCWKPAYGADARGDLVCSDCLIHDLDRDAQRLLAKLHLAGWDAL